MLSCRLIMPCTALAAVLMVPLSPVLAKVPGQTHCYNAVCHKVLTLDETRAAIGAVRKVRASFYDAPERDPANPGYETSSGERFRPERADNAASPIYPDGTRLLIWSKTSGMAALIRVNNAGPYHPRRELDVSKALAHRLGFAARGIAELQVMVVEAPSQSEATYARGRRYAAVPGVIGRFSDIEQASLAVYPSEEAATEEATAEARTLAPVPPIPRPAPAARPRATAHRAQAAVSRSKPARAQSTAGKNMQGEKVAEAAVAQRSAWTGRFFD